MQYNRNLIELLIYGTALGVLLLALKILQLKYILYHHSENIYIAIIALAFTLFGLWLSKHLFQKQTIEIAYIQQATLEKDGPLIQQDTNKMKIEQLGISRRELEILNMIALGFSNQEIATKLFISLSTVKSHASNIFFKLNVKSRTQAIDAARNLKILD